MTRVLVVLGVVTLLFSACVPNKKLVYFQKDDLKKRKEIPKDTVLRTHSLNIQEYKIQPLDLLSITFETISEDNDTFDFLSKLNPQVRAGGNIGASMALGGVMVDTEGVVEYPVLGKIPLVGLTLFAAEDSLQAVAGKYLPDVIVRVRMLNFRFTVLGEVNGEQVVTAVNPRLTMSEAIGMAGGFGELADRSHVKVIRQRGTNTEVFYLDLLQEDFLESPNYYVQQNDVIIVPPLKQRPFRRYFTTNLAVISSALSFVFLITTLATR